VALKLLVTDSVDFHEMPGEFVKHAAIPDRENVFDPMAVVTQRLESHQPLVSGALVVVPDLVAVEPCILSADLTSVPGASVHAPADTVPLWSWQELGETGHC